MMKSTVQGSLWIKIMTCKKRNSIIFILFFVFISRFFVSVPLCSANEAERIVGRTIPTDSRVEPMDGLELVGWSKDGKIAYKQAWTNHHIPGDGVEMIIFCLVKDKVIVRVRTTNVPAEPDKQKETKTENLKSIRQFEEALQAYGIVRAKYGYLDSLDGFQFYFDVSNPEKDTYALPPNYDELFMYSWDYKMVARNQDGQRKVIAQGKDKGVIYKTIVGCFFSPFERRVGVIVDTYYWGVEGEFYHDYKIYGCHLAAGFK